jgi:hypothetical protein
MQQIFISNEGDDTRDGLTRETAIKSWKRLMQLSRGGTQWVLMEGNATEKRLDEEAVSTSMMLRGSGASADAVSR